MGGRYNLIGKLKVFFSSVFNDHKEKRKWILIIALIGILFIVAGDYFKKGQPAELGVIKEADIEKKTEEIAEVALIKNVNEIESLYEKNLQSMLNQMKGISEVEVMVNVDSTNVQLYEKDMIYSTQKTDEIDKSGGERSIEDETKETKLVYVRQGDQEVPVLIKTSKPEVRGVFIIAKGVENAALKQLVVEAVSRVLDIPSYRISVVPR